LRNYTVAEAQHCALSVLDSQQSHSSGSLLQHIKPSPNSQLKHIVKNEEAYSQENTEGKAKEGLLKRL